MHGYEETPCRPWNLRSSMDDERNPEEVLRDGHMVQKKQAHLTSVEMVFHQRMLSFILHMYRLTSFEAPIPGGPSSNDECMFFPLPFRFR